MAKYKDVQTDIEEIFGTTAWNRRLITMLPSNYDGGVASPDFLRLEILPLRPLTNYGRLGISGNIIIQIYTKAGLGISRATEIADILDEFLQSKTLTRGTNTGTSSVSFLGVDSNDNTLFRADYLVPFRNYQ